MHIQICIYKYICIHIYIYIYCVCVSVCNTMYTCFFMNGGVHMEKSVYGRLANLRISRILVSRVIAPLPHSATVHGPESYPR